MDLLVALVFASVPSGAGAASSGTSHTARSKDWTVTVWVARTMTRAGVSIPAIVTVDNRTGHSAVIVGCPGTDYEIVAGNSAVPNNPGIPLELCSSKMGPGVHVFHTKVLTMYMGCGGEGNPPCGRPPKLSPLPAGTYRTQLILPGAKHSLPIPQPMTITLTGTAPKIRVLDCRAAQMLETIHSVPMKPPNSDNAWYGKVTYRNRGAECELATSTVSVIAESGDAYSTQPAMTNAPVLRGSPFTVEHGGSAHTWLEVTDRQPKNWQPGYCPARLVIGLDVGGPSKTWPLKYFALTPAVDICSDYIIKAASGSVDPGT